MSELFKHAKNTAQTLNGAETYASSLDACVDFFFLAGASRDKDIRSVFLKAIEADMDIALRILQWMRDIRGGAGERQQFRNLLSTLVSLDVPDKVMLPLIEKIPELGRWDDIHELFGTKYHDHAMLLILEGLKEGNPLCAKWTPRKGVVFNTIRRTIKATPKELRKLLVRMSNTVEQKMCADLWNDIDFSKVPSIAASRYSRAFERNSGEKYARYLEGLKEGTEKVNAKAIYPHDIVTNVLHGNLDLADAQWKALPDYLNGIGDNILPVIDVSGSMMSLLGQNSSNTCMQVAIALGLYLAERNNGLFKDKFITFSESPEFVEVEGSTLANRVTNISKAGWGYNTDLHKTFTTILRVALNNKLPEKELPTKVIILSDMEFDEACSNTNLEAIKAVYKASGYTMPELVFWNLKGRAGNVPARVDEEGVALVSGFSPAIMEAVLSGEDFTPRSIMLEAVMKDKYAL